MGFDYGLEVKDDGEGRITDNSMVCFAQLDGELIK